LGIILVITNTLGIVMVLVCLFFLGPAVVMGTLFKKGTAAHFVIASTVLVIVAEIILFFLVALLFGMNLVSEATGFIRDSYNLYSDIIVIPEEILEQAIYAMTQMIPVYIIIFAVYYTMVTYWIGRRLLNRSGYSFAGLPPVKEWRLRPLAVHFNDGFDNPIAGENMLHAVRILGVDLRTITSDFRECKDLKIVDLKASTPLLNNGTDIGIGAALYSVAYKEKINTIFYGQSYRTEGIRPIAWAYFDGDLVRSLHKKFGTVPLKKWSPSNAGYNLGVKEMAFYTLKGIKTFAPFYYYPYVRKDADELLKRELNWEYPGAHYYDDLYWSLITYVHRVKFNIDFRKIAYSALIRSQQMERNYALDALQDVYVLEDEKVINLCIKRLGITRAEFDAYLALPPKNFWDYPNSYSLLRLLKYPIWIASRLGFFTKIVYEKYFTLAYK